MNSEVLSIAFQAGIPCLFRGAPGVGKSSACMAVADALGLHIEVVLAALREPADFAGLPVVVDGQVSAMAPPDWAVRLYEKGSGVLFLDECLQVPPTTQGALMRVVFERKVGDLQLPEGVKVVAAGNPLEGSIFGYDLTPPLANRFCHLDWELRVDDWVQGTLLDWPTPRVTKLRENWLNERPSQASLVASYIRTRPHKLQQVPTNEAQASKGWPSGRSWSNAITMMTAAYSAGMGDDVARLFTAGCVGESDAHEFWAWRRDLDLPDPESLIANPDSYRHPKRGDQVFAVVTSVIAALTQKPTEARWLAVWEVLERVCRLSGADIVAAGCKGIQGVHRAEWAIPKTQMPELVAVLKLAGQWGKK